MNDQQQHTPGPWSVEADEKNVHLHPCYQHRFITAGNEDSGTWEIVARMPDAPNQEANARLIAAAPELLYALETILATCGVRIDDPRCKHFDAGQAAVTKALGVETWPEAKALIKEKYPDLPHLTENVGKVLMAAYDLLYLVEDAAAPGGIGPYEFSRPGGWLERANLALARAGRKNKAE